MDLFVLKFFNPKRGKKNPSVTWNILWGLLVPWVFVKRLCPSASAVTSSPLPQAVSQARVGGRELEGTKDVGSHPHQGTPGPEGSV